MRSNCVRQAIVSTVAGVAWTVTLWLMWAKPGADDALRLPFFTALGVAIGATSLACFPWMMAGYVQQLTTAYVAGYLHRETDEPKDEDRPRLEVLHGGRV